MAETQPMTHTQQLEWLLQAAHRHAVILNYTTMEAGGASERLAQLEYRLKEINGHIVAMRKRMEKEVK